MTYAHNLSKHSSRIKLHIRKIETIEYKLLRFKWSTILNKICFKENLKSDYTIIKYITWLIFECDKEKNFVQK